MIRASISTGPVIRAALRSMRQVDCAGGCSVYLNEGDPGRRGRKETHPFHESKQAKALSHMVGAGSQVSSLHLKNSHRIATQDCCPRLEG